MNTLTTYIKAQPKKPMRQWAEAIGISRSYLIALMDGDRTPSVEVAQRIESATEKNVPVTDWPNIKALSDALRGDAA